MLWWLAPCETSCSRTRFWRVFDRNSVDDGRFVISELSTYWIDRSLKSRRCRTVFSMAVRWRGEVGALFIGPGPKRTSSRSIKLAPTERVHTAELVPAVRS
jgi:hypothetical protein